MDDKSTPESLAGCRLALRSLFLNRQIDEPTYFKGLIDLAFRWVELGDREQVVSLFSDVTPEYIDYALRSHIQEDAEFAAHALVVATYIDGNTPNVEDDDVKIALMLLEKPVAKA